MAWNRKTVGRLLCTALYFFFCGVEYAVILPTLNGYLNSLDAPPAFIGVLMASFSFSGLIASPIFGLISDKTKSSKFAVILSNVFEMVGNFLYFCGKNWYVLWISRLVAGIGAGASSSILGMLARTTSTAERTSVMSVVMAMRQVGLVIGPGVNVFFHNLNAAIGPFPINSFTTPGIFMVGLWLLHSVLVIFFYNEDPEDYVTVETRTENRSPLSWRSLYNEFVREEVVFCIALTFISMFSQLGIEAALTPLTLLLFGWDGLYNSYLYCGAGFVIIVCYGFLSVLSRRCQDRSLIAFGVGTLIVAFVVLLGYSIPLYIDRDDIETPSFALPLFLIGVFILVIGLPFTWVPMASLFSKLTSMETQGFNQGIRLAAMNLGQILGPIWAAPMVTLTRLPTLGAIYLCLMLVILGMLKSSYSKLSPINIEINDESSIDEVTPLVRSELDEA